MFEKIARKLLEYKWDVSRFTTKDKIFFFKELAYLIQGGIVITDAIMLIRNNTDNSKIKEICDQIYSSLKKWETFSRTISKLPKHFNEWDANIIRSWEGSGELVNVLKYLASEYEFLYDIKNRYISAMVYPALIFGASIIAVYIIFTVILPWILEIIQDFEWATIPFTTQLLMDITNFLIEYNIAILIVLFLLALWFSIMFGIQEGKRWIDKQAFKIPIFGKLTKYYNLIKFLRYKKLLIASWMNYVQVFNSLKKIFNNSQYTDMFQDVLNNINKWQDIIDPMENYKNIIPPDVIVLLRAWMESANTESSIQNAIDLYQEDFDKNLNNLSKVIEPLLVIFVWAIIAFIALSVFGIVWSILDSATF